MKKKSTSQTAFFNRRVLIGLVVVLTGVFLVLVGFGAFSNLFAQAPSPSGQSGKQKPLARGQSRGPGLSGRVDNLMLPSGDNQLRAAVIGPTGKLAYFAYTAADSIPANRVVTWNDNEWLTTEWGSRASRPIQGLTEDTNQNGFLLSLVDWTNLGGNAQRNGMSSAVGPITDELAWSNTDDFSIIAWHPLTLGERVFAIRESGFPGANANDKLVAYDLATGEELWNTVVPYGGNPSEEWIAYAAGTHDGKVYAARGGSGRTTPIYAFDAETGNLVWSSLFETVAGPNDGVVFASDGDLIVGDFNWIARIESTDGSTVWQTQRPCPVSESCGAALGNGAAYIVEQTVGGPAVVRFDLATGERQYASDGLGGLTAQNPPFVGPDGTVYFARSQNNPAVDFLYAFDDTGSALVERWRVPVRWTTFHEHGVGSDGSVYTFLPGDEGRTAKISARAQRLTLPAQCTSLMDGPAAPIPTDACGPSAPTSRRSCSRSCLIVRTRAAHRSRPTARLSSPTARASSPTAQNQPPRLQRRRQQLQLQRLLQQLHPLLRRRLRLLPVQHHLLHQGLRRHQGLAQLHRRARDGATSLHGAGRLKPAEKILSIANLVCRSAGMRIDHHFAGTARNADKRGYNLVQELLAGKTRVAASGHSVKGSGGSPEPPWRLRSIAPT